MKIEVKIKMATSLKRYIKKGIEQNIPLGRIKRDLVKKGYSMERINKASREVIAGDYKLPLKAVVFGVAIVIVLGAVYFLSGYKIAEQPVERVATPVEESAIGSKQSVLLCDEFKNVESIISCNEAVERAIAGTPGSVEKISIGPVIVIDDSIDPPIIFKDAWLIDIKVDKPYFHEAFGKEVEFLRVGIGLNDDIGYYTEALESP